MSCSDTDRSVRIWCGGGFEGSAAQSRGTTSHSTRTVHSRVDIYAGVCSGVAPRTNRSQSRVGSRRSGGESTQEDEDIGPFSGFDDHTDVGAAQHPLDSSDLTESVINRADATVKANASRLAP